MVGETLEDPLEDLCEDIRCFYAVKSLKRLESPSRETFLREAVAVHQPCVVRGLLQEWPALEKWQTTSGFLADAPERVPVNFTPNGRADAIVDDEYFVTPTEAMMETKLFMEMLERPCEEDAVPYLSSQNDNVRTNMPSLLDSIPKGIPLAEDCFKDDENESLEAINLWIGDERSVSSTHKDYFENFYCVVRGEKEFTLYPPTDVMHLKSSQYHMASYQWRQPEDAAKNTVFRDGKRPQKTELQLIPDPEEGKVRWLRPDPALPDDGTYPSIPRANPITVRVQAGEVLYLPALWLHRVTQTRLTVSVNFWYAMKFDLRYVLFKFASKLFDRDEDDDGN